MRKNYFRGWYYRFQSEKNTVAVIAALHVSGGKRSGSVQLITDTANYCVDFDDAYVEKKHAAARLGRCSFSENEIKIDLNKTENGIDAEGTLSLSGLTPLRYGIMGPFRFVPFMECRHTVISMKHCVNGRLRINGEVFLFENADGYIEGDRGTSFPEKYGWTQCFFDRGSIMLSVAEIPLGPARFTGAIGVVLLDGKEYRLATYLGARVKKHGDGELSVRQGRYELTARQSDPGGFALRAPVKGEMTRLIREKLSCRASYVFTVNGRELLSLDSDKAAFELEY